MMQLSVIISFILLNLPNISFALSESAPDLPPNPCYMGCTPQMKNIWNLFVHHPKPVSMKPNVYSGECQYLSHDYNPLQIHHAVVMIDDLPTMTPYFSTIFSFFAPKDDFADWDLAAGRREMSPYWKVNGKILESSQTSRVEIRDSGQVVNAYWMRQDPISRDLYYITYMNGSYLKAFCLLREHPFK
jgi:hypothetical protein